MAKLMSDKSYEIFIELEKKINEEVKDEDKAKMLCELLEDFTYSMVGK